MGLAPYKRDSKEIPSHFHPLRAQQEDTAMNQKEGPRPTVLAP